MVLYAMLLRTHICVSDIGRVKMHRERCTVVFVITASSSPVLLYPTLMFIPRQLLGQSSLQTRSKDQHISGADKRIGKNTEVTIFKLRTPY